MSEPVSVDRTLGRIEGALTALHEKLDDHVSDEDGRLARVEDRLGKLDESVQALKTDREVSKALVKRWATGISAVVGLLAAFVLEGVRWWVFPKS
jgi:hypothetical protein